MPEKLEATEAKAKPTRWIGRGSWVQYQNNYDSEPCPALVTHVWPGEDGKLLNLTVFDRDGETRAAARIYQGEQVGTWRMPA